MADFFGRCIDGKCEVFYGDGHLKGHCVWCGRPSVTTVMNSFRRHEMTNPQSLKEILSAFQSMTLHLWNCKVSEEFDKERAEAKAAILAYFKERLPKKYHCPPHDNHKCTVCKEYCFDDDYCGCCRKRPGWNAYHDAVIKALDEKD